MRRTILTAALLGTMLAPGCSEDEDARVMEFTDTTGVRFTYTCTRASCNTGTDDTSCDAKDGLLTSGRLLHACTLLGNAAYNENCRPVACQTNENCPRMGDTPFHCQQGLCQNATWTEPLPWTKRDVVGLCLADVPRTEFCRQTPFQPPSHPRLQWAKDACPNPEGPTSDLCPKLAEQCRQP